MMKEIKRKNVIILSILAIIIVLIMGGLIFNFYKERLVKEKKIASLNDTASGMQDNNKNINTNISENIDTNANVSTNTNTNVNANTNTNTSNKNNIIGETTSIEISILDENAQGLIYTEPVKIEDQNIIKELVTELNNSEELSKELQEKYPISFEGAPTVIFNLKDGSKIGAVGNIFSGPYENKFVFKTSIREDWTADGVYRLKSSADLESYINELYEKNKENQVASSLNYSNKNKINLILGSYTVQSGEKVLGDEYITFLENNKFNAYKGFGISISGTYTISDNKINCIADTYYSDYGPNQKISASISFKINSNSELEVIDATESFKIKVVDIPTNSLTDETNDIFLSPFEKGIKFVLSK